MLKRNIDKYLLEWKGRKDKKPLILRGARQTGKTTSIRELGSHYPQFIELNLEKATDLDLVESADSLEELLTSITVVTKKEPVRSLLFFDEIQNSPKAIKFLRFFYEEHPEIDVIAAGSLLEVLIADKGFSFPVGRIEFAYLFPLTFAEFLMAIEEDELLDFLNSLAPDSKIPKPIHNKCMQLLSMFLFVGGMPEVVSTYVSTGDHVRVNKIKQDLLQSFYEDMWKYNAPQEVRRLESVFKACSLSIGQRIKYEKFVGNYDSKTVKKAIEILETAMLVRRIFPTWSLKLPFELKKKAAPKIISIDIGLSNFQRGVLDSKFFEKNISSVYEGGAAEAYVAQELLAADNSQLSSLWFWVRQDSNSISEVDFLLVNKSQKPIPLEIKRGVSGTLKSLHRFLYESGADVGIRVYTGELKHEMTVNKVEEKDVPYTLYSIPLYLAYRLKEFF
ncbi:MAG: ATP-binding protein [Candidatus Anammoxibacter sp.]